MKVFKGFNSRRKQQGISLLEVLLSLSIIAIILIMATRYFFVANENKNVNQTRAQIGALLAATQLWKGSKPTYTGMTMQALIDTGDFPQSDNVSNGSLYNPWGYQIQLEPQQNSFKIITTLPTNSDCLKVLSSYPKAVCESGTFTLTEGVSK